MTNLESFAALMKVLDFNSKRELESYCRGLTIDSEDFFYLILAAEQSLIPYAHRIHHRDIIPKELTLGHEPHGPVETDKSGRLVGGSLKFFRKVTQIFHVRRFLVGHLFFSSDLHNWHFLYFDQRDQSPHSNHWKHGPHIHLINWLWPNYSAKSLWNEFTIGNPKMRGALHIKYTDNNRGEPIAPPRA